MDDDYKMGLSLACLAAFVILWIVSINVTTDHKCRMAAIAAGMNAGEVKEACR